MTVEQVAIHTMRTMQYMRHQALRSRHGRSSLLGTLERPAFPPTSFQLAAAVQADVLKSLSEHPFLCCIAAAAFAAAA